jgi:hypothetical protein
MLTVIALAWAALMFHPVGLYDLRDDHGTGVVFVDRTPTHDDHSLSMALEFRDGEVRRVSSSRQRVIYPCDCIHMRTDPPDGQSFLYSIGAMWATLTGHTVWVYDFRFDSEPTGTSAGDIVVDTTPHRNDRSLSLHLHFNDHARVRRVWTNRTEVITRNDPRIHHRPLRVDPPQ